MMAGMTVLGNGKSPIFSWSIVQRTRPSGAAASRAAARRPARSAPGPRTGPQQPLRQLRHVERPFHQHLAVAPAPRRRNRTPGAARAPAPGRSAPPARPARCPRTPARRGGPGRGAPPRRASRRPRLGRHVHRRRRLRNAAHAAVEVREPVPVDVADDRRREQDDQAADAGQDVLEAAHATGPLPRRGRSGPRATAPCTWRPSARARSASGPRSRPRSSPGTRWPPRDARSPRQDRRAARSARRGPASGAGGTGAARARSRASISAFSTSLASSSSAGCRSTPIHTTRGRARLGKAPTPPSATSNGRAGRTAAASASPIGAHLASSDLARESGG